MNLLLAQTFVCFAFVAASAAKNHSWRAKDLPNPYTSSEACGRASKSWICDPDKLLPASDLDAIEGILNTIALAKDPYPVSQCGSAQVPGHQVAVAIVGKMAGQPAGSAADAGFAFAKIVHDSWGVGHAACNDGTLLLVSLGDRTVSVSSGKGVKDKLDEDRVVQTIIPFMKTGNYAQGVREGVLQIGLGLAGKHEKSRPLSTILWIGCLSVMGLLVLGPSLTEARKKWRVRRKLEILQKAEKAVRDGSYECTTCPICMEEFEMPKIDANTQEQVERKTFWPSVNSAKRTPIMLECRHLFCKKCLLQWLKNKNTCPICRRAVVSGSESAYPTSDGHEYGPQRLDSETWEPEMAFRLQRLNEMYPGYVSLRMIDTWHRHYRRHKLFDFRSHADFRCWDQPSNSSHGTGVYQATGSFGGGSSSGGGGASASW